MQGGSQQTLAGDIASAIAWWRDAGVDCAFTDEPNAWIAPPEPVVDTPADNPARPAAYAPPPPPPLPRIGGDSAGWPQELKAFRQWWLEEPSLDSAEAADRIVPRGAAGASLMILVEQPDALTQGPQARLLASMLAAMGKSADEVYLSAVFVRPTPVPDWATLEKAGLGELTRHHVHLAAPERLIVFGGNILPLLGHDPAQSAQSLHAFNHEGRTIPLLAAHGLDALVRPNAKAAFWRRWLEWTGD
ncbi:hypothetical protein [Novosphingobium sp. TH158]|uniref:hypothetical protein n=1 Tax=Novosphingobium sp. TH158 TaxID=2067455 RepID=UPI000C7D7DA1|nr:hypothetical protein [Novosphingobium sp. TH158]PLK26237.1 hypothetical protein C0V78_04565 [Novosphingobium sp. TH158]